MGWFEYGTPVRRHLRKGVHLRTSALPQNLRDVVKERLRERTNEYPYHVKVSEIRPHNKVLLEFWCREPGDDRYTVFHELVDEDPNWVCEADCGRGYKG